MKEELRTAEGLLERAQEYMIQGQCVETDNCPLYPVVIIFCGETTVQYWKELKNSLDINWGRYASRIPYVQMFCDSGAVLRAKDLRTDATGEADEICQKCIMELLALPDTFFPNRNKIKIECLISSADRWETYKTALEQIGKQLGMETLRTLYLMAEQQSTQEKHQTRVFAEMLWEQDKEGKLDFQAVYFLSNYLNGNFFLDEKHLGENYRLVSNLILLGGNVRREQMADTQFISRMYRGMFKTVSYDRKQKPVEDIVVHSISYFLKKAVENEKQVGRTREDIQKLLGIDGKRVSALETVYKEIQNLLPSEKALHGFALRKGKLTGDLKNFEHYTYGASRLFFERYFKEAVDKWITANREAAAKEIVKNWESKLSYSEKKQYFIDAAFLDSFQSINVQITGTAKTPQGIAYNRYQQELKKYFYEKMTEAIRSSLTAMNEKYQELDGQFQSLQEEIEKRNYTSKELKKSIEQCYDTEIDNFLRKHKEEIEKSLFNPDFSKEQFLGEVAGWFCRLVNESELYGMSFESELSKRMGQAGREEQILFLHRELGEDLQKSRRMHLFRDTGTDGGEYYLVNQDAEYARLLKKDNSGLQMFDLNRTDCIEKVAVVDIEDIQYIDFLEERYD